MWGFSASIRLGGAGPIWAGVRLYTLYGGCPGTDASNDIVPVLVCLTLTNQDATAN